LKNGEAEWTLQVPAALVLVLGCFNCRNRVKAEPAVESLDFVFMQAVTAETLVALEAEVHFLADELSEASALVMHERSLESGKLKH
jgi:hypothetical protein